MCSGLNIVSRNTQKYATLNPKDGKKEKHHAFDNSHSQIFEGNRSKI